MAYSKLEPSSLFFVEPSPVDDEDGMAVIIYSTQDHDHMR
jgi:hypothetical protein